MFPFDDVNMLNAGQATACLNQKFRSVSPRNKPKDIKE